MLPALHGGPLGCLRLGAGAHVLSSIIDTGRHGAV